MIKIRWGDLLIRLQQLRAARFCISRGGKVIKAGRVAEVQPVGRSIKMVADNGEVHFFPNEDSFAFRRPSGEVLMKRHGEYKLDKESGIWFQLIDTFLFEPNSPFPLSQK